jgi:hypothetical protein
LTLEFEKVAPQVERMGRALAARNVTLSERLAEAWHRLQALDDLGAIRDRIQLARQNDAGFRGAAPAFHHETGELLIHEPLNRAYPLPPTPEHATIVAADGSQVYPSIHAAALYYLTNIGVFVYHHGRDHLPEQVTEPRLHYNEVDVHDAQGQVIANEAVNARRSVGEIQVLAREAWYRRETDGPLLALRDGPLLFWVGKEVPDGRQLEDDYKGTLVWLHDLHEAMQRERGQSANLAGYVDRPTSAFIVSLLHLMGLPDEDVHKPVLDSNGDFEGMLDQSLLFKLLGPGERSALMVQQSPQNKRYHDKGENFEVAFFYLNVGAPHDYHLARVEMPMWVARDPALVAVVHALIHDQCQIMWRYPYALTRADELAVVRAHEKSQLNEMIEIELRRNEQQVEHSEKLASKVSRYGRTRYGRRRR